MGDGYIHAAKVVLTRADHLDGGIGGDSFGRVRVTRSGVSELPRRSPVQSSSGTEAMVL